MGDIILCQILLYTLFEGFTLKQYITFQFISKAVSSAEIGSKYIQKAGPFPASTVISIAVALIYSILVGLQGLQMPLIASGWLAIVASALISTVLGIMALFAGLKRIDTANAAIISTFEVVVVVVLSVIILGETITLHKVLGACLVIGAVIILTKSEYRTAQAQIR